MLADLEPMTLGERYSTAVKSSHLEVVAHKRGDVDIIMAAGAARRRACDSHGDDMADGLMRLMQEFDQALSEVRLAQRNDAAMQAQAKTAGKRGAKTAAAEIKDAAHKSALQARAHILLKLHSLAVTREAFGQWASRQAQRVRFMDPGPVPLALADVKIWAAKVRRRDEVVRAIADRVLDITLDPLCTRCDGRGFNGGYDGSPQTFICRHCTAGRRKVDTQEQAEDEFAKRLQVQVETMVGSFRSEMRDLLR